MSTLRVYVVHQCPKPEITDVSREYRFECSCGTTWTYTGGATREYEHKRRPWSRTIEIRTAVYEGHWRIVEEGQDYGLWIDVRQPVPRTYA